MVLLGSVAYWCTGNCNNPQTTGTRRRGQRIMLSVLDLRPPSPGLLPRASYGWVSSALTTSIVMVPTTEYFTGNRYIVTSLCILAHLNP